VGFSFRAEGVKISIATDLGYMPDSIRFHLRGSDALLLESNHDVEMLKVGPYPWALKQRIMGRNGHLSNDVACNFIRDELDTRTSTLILGHLSAHNNHPEIVRLMAAQALDGRSLFTRLVIAEPKTAPEQPAECFVY
jgi:phosphoribosyl 1,2-cyclic phosphodiesterase